MPVRELPYLIQRVILREEPKTSSKGIDSGFSFDYMGSSEFECGALFHTLKAMRANKRKDMKISKIDLPEGRCFYYLGLDAEKDVAKLIMEDQLGPRSMRLKEGTRIQDSYGVKGSRGGRFFDGWWPVDNEYTGYTFVMFRTEEAAKAWLALL